MQLSSTQLKYIMEKARSVIKNSPLFIQTMIRLTSDGNQITATGTNSEVFVTTSVPCSTEKFDICVPQDVLNYLSKCSGNLEFEIMDHRNFKLGGIQTFYEPGKDFMNLPSDEYELTHSFDGIMDAIKVASPARMKEESNYFSGVCLASGAVYCGDGNRVIKCMVDHPFDVVLSKDTTDVLMKNVTHGAMCGTVGDLFIVKSGDTVIYGRTLDVKYPHEKIDQFFAAFKCNMGIDRVEFLNTLTRAMAINASEYVELSTYDGILSMSVEGATSKTKEQMPFQHEFETIKFRCRDLLDAFKGACDETVEMYAGHPFVVREPGYEALAAKIV